MINKTANQNLEKVVSETEVKKIPEGFVRCHYCDKPIEKGKEYISPCSNPYCNKNCFDMYTED